MLDYSPLCDVSYSAYIAYLAANIADKGRHDVFVSVFRGESGRESDGGCVDVGGYVSALDGGCAGTAINNALAGVCDSGVEDGVDGDDNSGVGHAAGRVAGAQGGAGDIPCGGGVVAAGVGGDGLLRETSQQQVLGEVPAVGRWYWSNKRKKEKRKSRRAGSVPGGALADVSVDESSGSVSKDVEVSESVAGRVGFDRCQFESVVSVGERKQLARGWYERKCAENRLATQRANYNFKRNEYLDRARISEKKWEQERLSCEQKLANITEARFGSKPGYAETLASISDGSELPPSLSTGSSSPANLTDGTISPNSSMSVAEENRLKRKVEELSGKVKEMELRETAFHAGLSFSKGHAEVENGKVHVYDGSGQYVPPSLSGASQPSVCFSDYL